MNLRYVRLLLLTLAAFALSHCTFSGEKNTAQSAPNADPSVAEGRMPVERIRRIQPPSKALDVPFATYKVASSSPTTLTMPSGTRLSIPANAFVFEDGSPARGKVEFRYREFRNAADIFRSGIPMEYDSAGQTHWFSSAGMMEMRASSEGRELALAPNKEIRVAFPSSSQQGGDYNLYSFNEKTGNWENQQNTLKLETVEVAADDAANGKKAKRQPNQQLRQTAEPFSFTIRAKSMPGLEDLNGTDWLALCTDKAEFADLSKNPRLLNEAWTTASIDNYPGQSGLFTLQLSNGQKNISLLVRPESDQLAETITPRSATVPPPPTPVNMYSFGLSRLGIANCDRIMHSSSRRDLMVDFQDQSGVKLAVSNVYLVLPKENSVLVQFSNTNIMYDTKLRCGLLITLEDSRMAIIPAEQFLNLAKNSKSANYRVAPATFDPEALEEAILGV